MTDLAVAEAVDGIDLARPNEEAIRLLRTDRKTAVAWRGTREEAHKRHQSECEECARDIKQMTARIEAIDRAIVTLGGKPSEKSEG